MQFKKISIKDLEKLLNLEYQMYWSSEKWADIWEKEVKSSFRKMLTGYISDFNKFCFGIWQNENLVGAMGFCKLDKIKTISYLHDPRNHFDNNGKIGYVTVFVVQKGEDEERIASSLYQQAEKVASKKGCNKLIVVIYSSPIEVKILEKRDYMIELKGEVWEIVPGMKVKCDIWAKQLT